MFVKPSKFEEMMKDPRAKIEKVKNFDEIP